MIKRLKKLLNSTKDVNAWKIIGKEIQAEELFFIKNNLDMNRSKTVKHIYLTIYHDFKEDRNYRGSVSVRLHPTYSTKEVEDVINKCLLSIKHVRNEPYPLPKPAESSVRIPESRFVSKPIEDWLKPLSESLFQEDTFKNGCINSAELFLNREQTRILNSEGIDVSWSSYNGTLEVITEWNGGDEDVELYKLVHFSDFFTDNFPDIVKNQLTLCQDRSTAKPTPPMNAPVLLSGEPVQELLSYYLSQASAENVYNQISLAKPGESIQGEKITGDKINIHLEPYLENSIGSSAWDMDGFSLKPVSIIENGILKKYWGPLRFTHYLDSPPTGRVPNIVVSPGKQPVDEIRRDEYLEILSFSDFQCDPLTGDFGGEIRLAYYSPEKSGNNRYPVTGGSISGNIKNVQHELILSKETRVMDNFKGPEMIKLLNVSITGAE